MFDIYFDNSSTTKPYLEVIKTFETISLDYFANSASSHKLGYISNDLLKKARKQIAKSLNVSAKEVFFTSGATEGNNLAIKGVALREQKRKKTIITTKAEHPSVIAVFKELEEEGFKAIYLDYDKEGNLDLNQLEKSISDDVSLVSIMAVNNETGYIFPINEIAKIIRSHSKAYFHIDATQAIGKEDINFTDYDLLTFSGHKIGGLKGSGILVKKNNVLLKPQILGGGQESGLRSGTSALALDCSLATALKISLKTRVERRKQAIRINSYLRKEMSKIDDIVITSPMSATPFILNFAFKKHKGSVIAEALSNQGIYVSTTSACSSRTSSESEVLKHAGFDSHIVSNSIRLSFNGEETLEEASDFISCLKEILKEIIEDGD